MKANDEQHRLKKKKKKEENEHIKSAQREQKRILTHLRGPELVRGVRARVRPRLYDGERTRMMEITRQETQRQPSLLVWVNNVVNEQQEMHETEEHTLFPTPSWRQYEEEERIQTMRSKYKAWIKLRWAGMWWDVMRWHVMRWHVMRWAGKEISDPGSSCSCHQQRHWRSGRTTCKTEREKEKDKERKS